jgi:autotransporter translocation and assembly factor TamB
LSIVQTLLGGVKLSGLLAVNAKARGTMRAPVFDINSISIRNGVAEVAPLGVTLTGINGNVSGGVNAAGQDSVQFTVAASTEGDANGTVRVEGVAKNLWVRGGRTGLPQPLRLAVGARSFHAFDKRSLADVYISTTDSLRLIGSVQSSVLSGALRVDRGAIFLADPVLARKRAVQIFAADSAQSAAARVPAMLSTLMSNLEISDVKVTIPSRSDFRLRSAEANVRLEGELQLIPSITHSSRRLASTGQLIPEFALEGSLRTIGGTYNLNLGLVQREFQVLSDGTVTFNGTLNNPLLDIRAQYNVPQHHDRDLGVIVRLHGPLLPYPVISFASTADYDIATSDLLSYLLTGRPGFDFGSNPGATQVLSVLAPTLSAVTSAQLRQRFGSVFSMFQFQLGTGSSSADGSAGGPLGNVKLSEYLYGSTIGAEKQFSNNLFLNVNTGLCQFETNNNRSFNSLVGAKIEYRFKPNFSTQLAYDPSTIARTCGQAQSIIGLVPTPPQFSLGFFHTWRF